MTSRLSVIAAFVLGLALGQLKAPVAHGQIRAMKTHNILTTDLAGWCGGKQITVEVNEAGPGTSGKHYHPAHSFTYILEGSEAYALDGQPSRTVAAGDVLHEAPMQLHTVDNVSPVKLLVVRIIERGKDATVRVP